MKIPLTQGKFAEIDDEDFELVNQYKWFCTSNGYAATYVYVGEERCILYMHDLIMGLPPRHINRDPYADNEQELLQ